MTFLCAITPPSSLHGLFISVHTPGIAYAHDFIYTHITLQFKPCLAQTMVDYTVMGDTTLSTSGASNGSSCPHSAQHSHSNAHHMQHPATATSIIIPIVFSDIIIIVIHDVSTFFIIMYIVVRNVCGPVL